jgi:integrase/recombinase XerD
MYACGLRASEAIDLEVRDVDLYAGILRARGKGSKERLVPVGRDAIAAVRAYLQHGARGWSACARSATCSSTTAGRA